MTEKFIEKIKRKFFKKKIIQFGPIRSGTTLLYNYLRECFPNHTVVKTHQLTKKDCDKYPVVASVRNPFDCIASSLLIHDIDPKKEPLEKHIQEIRIHGFNDLMKLHKHPNVLLLKYEDFKHNTEYILSSIEKKYNVIISEEKKSDIIEKYKIEQVEKMISKFPKFEEFDKENLLHGKHISKFKGEPGYYKKVFTEKQIILLKDEFSDVLTEFNY